MDGYDSINCLIHSSACVNRLSDFYLPFENLLFFLSIEGVLWNYLELDCKNPEGCMLLNRGRPSIQSTNEICSFVSVASVQNQESIVGSGFAKRSTGTKKPSARL